MHIPAGRRLSRQVFRQLANKPAELELAAVFGAYFSEFEKQAPKTAASAILICHAIGRVRKQARRYSRRACLMHDFPAATR
ncbi:hypothetical protein Hsw_0452 [Hymenobacter swuensis DY53]|uniref:Uncharacterized protein n=1 Tax=Hymenobacter swuensis DY53 TaxID=1227739 RepID=W8EWB1_9BACT|nr:hypothetical protein Hsw_0452 [Hymenobacter swuensis DY53]